MTFILKGDEHNSDKVLDISVLFWLAKKTEFLKIDSRQEIEQVLLLYSCYNVVNVIKIASIIINSFKVLMGPIRSF